MRVAIILVIVCWNFSFKRTFKKSRREFNIFATQLYILQNFVLKSDKNKRTDILMPNNQHHSHRPYNNHKPTNKQKTADNSYFGMQTIFEFIEIDIIK